MDKQLEQLLLDARDAVAAHNTTPHLADLLKRIDDVVGKKPVEQPEYSPHRLAFDKWFRKTQMISDSIDTTWISQAFLPYRAWCAALEYAKTLGNKDGA